MHESEKGKQSTGRVGTPSVSRRSLLKGTVSAMPAVLTLQSGAAFARSSNLISASPHNHKDRWQRTLCLDLKSVYPVDGSRRRFDLGDPAYGRVNAIRERDYYRVTSYGVRGASEGDMCKRGGTYYYRERQSSYRRGYGSGANLSQSDIEQISQMESNGFSQDASASMGSYGGGGSYGGYQEQQWRRVKLHRGVLVSATALSSFAGNIVVKDI